MYSDAYKCVMSFSLKDLQSFGGTQRVSAAVKGQGRFCLLPEILWEIKVEKKLRILNINN
jgi:hypothetical protein